MLVSFCGNVADLSPGLLIKALCCSAGLWGFGWSLPATTLLQPPQCASVKPPTSFTLQVYLLVFDGTVITFLVLVT